MTKVALLTPFYAPSIGGVESYAEALGREMAAHKVSVEVHTAAVTASGERLASGTSGERGGVTVCRYRAWVRLGEFAWLWPGVLRGLLRSRPDVVLTNSTGHPHSLFALFAGRLMAKRVVLVSHANEVAFSAAAGRLGGRGLFDSSLGRAAARRYDQVVCVSEPSIKYFVDRGCAPERVRWIPGGIDPAIVGAGNGPRFRAKFGYSESDTLVGCASRIDKLAASAILPALVRERPSFRFVFAGPGAFAEVDGASWWRAPNVKHHGFLEPSDLLDFLAALDAFVLPSSSDAFPLTAIQALAQGTPCLFTRNCGLTSIADGASAVAVEPGNEPEWAAAVDAAVARGSRPARAEKARALAAGLTWASILEQVEAFALTPAGGGTSRSVEGAARAA